MNKFTLPSVYLRYLQDGKETQRRTLPGLMISKPAKDGSSVVSIDQSKLPSIFKRNKILPDALEALNLISQLPEKDAEKDKMATEIKRHLFALTPTKGTSFIHFGEIYLKKSQDSSRVLADPFPLAGLIYQEKLFSTINLRQMMPDTHLLVKIDKALDLSFIYELTKNSTVKITVVLRLILLYFFVYKLLVIYME